MHANTDYELREDAVFRFLQFASLELEYTLTEHERRFFERIRVYLVNNGAEEDTLDELRDNPLDQDLADKVQNQLNN